MKKLATLLLAAGMVVSASAPASAMDFKVDGFYKFAFQTGQTGFDGANDENVVQRMRLGLTMAASENLSGYFQIQVGTDHWGTTNDTNGITDGGGIRARQAYIDWKVPGTDVQVRMGRQALSLPADAFGGNGVLCAGWGVRDGVVVASPVTDWLGLSAMWVRTAYNNHATDKADLDTNNSDDFYAVVADAKFDGVTAAVYGAYATIDAGTAGKDIGPSAISNNFGQYVPGKAWWAGFTSTFTMFDPFTFKLSAAYGSFEADYGNEKADQDGWNVQAKASYKTAYGTPVLGAFYFSGDDKGEDYGIMPSLGGYFTPTLTYHDASNGLVGGVCAFMPAGNWGVQAGIEDVSFLQGLSHNFHITYMEGTNDKDSERVKNGSDTYLSEDDSLVSFDLLNKYEIYKNLNVYLEASYIISDFDKADSKKNYLSEDDWRAELIFVYDF